MNQTLLLSRNPNIFARVNFCKTSQTFKSTFKQSCSSDPRSLAVKCNNNGEQNGTGNMREALSGLVGEQVNELLKKEENKVLLDELEKATLVVELAKKELGEIERREIEVLRKKDYIKQLEKRAFEMDECQREIGEAKSMLEEAERSLLSEDGDPFQETKAEEREKIEIDKDEERIESVKAALISGVAGTITSLPIAFTGVKTTSELIFPVAITFISCALFGVTFRYAVRRDLDNFQLKTGTAAAFGFVKGLGRLGGGPPLELETGSILSHGFNGAVYVSESVLIFLFAAVSLDFCFKFRILSPFPKRKIKL